MFVQFFPFAVGETYPLWHAHVNTVLGESIPVQVEKVPQTIEQTDAGCVEIR